MTELRIGDRVTTITGIIDTDRNIPISTVGIVKSLSGGEVTVGVDGKEYLYFEDEIQLSSELK